MLTRRDRTSEATQRAENPQKRLFLGQPNYNGGIIEVLKSIFASKYD